MKYSSLNSGVLAAPRESPRLYRGILSNYDRQKPYVGYGYTQSGVKC